MRPSTLIGLAAAVLIVATRPALAQPAYSHYPDVASLHQAMRAGELTAAVLVERQLSRIDLLNPELAAVIAVDPTARAQARALDAALADGDWAGPLHGIPVLVKDNIETRDQPTTAGSLALADNDTGRDAPLVARLREAGAVILGKANLSEWANFRSERSSSGWSAVGGQTRNPYDPARTPCGSSSGSGAAVAAGMAVVAVGTETNGSIVCPASANGLVGIKPSVGLVSRTHVVPISHNQDTAGPMARSVRDAVVLLAAMAGADPDDPATAEPAEWAPESLIEHVRDDGLEGKRIGVLRSAAGFHGDVDELLEAAIDTLRAGGAEIIDDLEWQAPDGFYGRTYDVLLYEFKAAIDAYLAALPDPTLAAMTLDDLIAFNRDHADEEMAWFGQEIFVKAAEKGPLTDEDYTEALAAVQQATRADGIDRLLAEHELDALIAPTGSPAWTIDLVNGDHFIGGSSTLAAVSGYPNVTVPMGRVHGLPVGLSIFGARYSEPVLIEIARGFERAAGGFVAPARGRTGARTRTNAKPTE
jgi:amidase